MNKHLFLVLLFLLSLQAWGRGKLVLIGGGARPASVIKELMALSQGNVLVIPLASEVPAETSAGIQAELAAEGAKTVKVFSCDHEKKDLPVCLDEIRNANLIYFTGGSQTRLIAGLLNTESLRVIRSRFNEGLHLAGTSAGTAVMSEVMITGGLLAPYSHFDGIRPAMVETARGFGFIRKFVVDMHFLTRSRESRLISAVLDHPGLLGVGIDEATAIVVSEDESFRVIGDSAAMVIDPRRSQTAVENQSYKVQNLNVSLLTAGQEFKP